MTPMWTNSADSHFLEPADLWQSRLPRRLAVLTPVAEKDADGEYETVRVDGQSFRRKLPSSASVQFHDESNKPRGVRDARARLTDLDREGVWGEVIFQRAAMKMVASGALDRHPQLRVLISEGGATWVPFLGDRMLEGYRQHHMAVRPKLRRDPKETLMTQVYASFQHDRTAVATFEHLGYRNVLFGSDYPHLEGTFGHTQKTLAELFAGVAPATTKRITQDAFYELFPHVPPVPASTDVIGG